MPTIIDASQYITDILNTARLAPSVHNTQAWKVSTDGANIHVSTDLAHKLKDGDPTGRQTCISLGIFCEAVLRASGGSGLQARIIDQKSDECTIQLGPAAASTAVIDAEFGALLSHRSSDRSIYSPIQLSETSIEENLASIQVHDGVTIMLSTDPELISTVAGLTAKGIKLALSSPGFRNELQQYLVLPNSSKKRGISVKSLYLPTPVAVLQPFMLRHGLGLGKEAATEKKRWESASGVVFILGDGDLAKYWFAAGRAYLQASLAIERSGLAQATSAAIVEASNYHEDIEQLLGTNQRILSIIRIGTGVKNRQYSPRISVEELLHS